MKQVHEEWKLGNEKYLRARGAFETLDHYAKRLLETSDEAKHCGDHCRNSCLWCGLREAHEIISALEGEAISTKGAK
jgi:hypothetical protein